MFWLTILPVIPEIYPIIIAIINIKLLPLVDLDLILLITEIGQEIPKQTSIINSKICIKTPFFLLNYYNYTILVKKSKTKTHV